MKEQLIKIEKMLNGIVNKQDSDETENKNDAVESFLKGGRSKGEEFDYDEDEMDLGMEVEKEHTDNEEIIHKMVLDHLIENPEYYSKLKKAEL